MCYLLFDEMYCQVEVYTMVHTLGRNQGAKLSSSCLVLFQSDICVIDGSCYEDGDVNPHNASQVCRVGQQTTLWTVVTSKSFPLLSLSQNTCRTVSKCLQDFHSRFLKLHIKCQTFFSFLMLTDNKQVHLSFLNRYLCVHTFFYYCQEQTL